MLTIFMLLNATTEWLQLSPEQREQVVASEVAPIFAAYKSLRLRFYDAEAFSKHCSDILVIEADASTTTPEPSTRCATRPSTPCPTSAWWTSSPPTPPTSHRAATGRTASHLATR